MAYITIDDLKAEGLVEAADAAFTTRVQRLIDLACKWFDDVTGQWFESRSFTEEAPMLLDGSGKITLRLAVPIIEIEKVTVDDVEIDEDDYVVYNRRVPDDRGNPKLVMLDEVAWSEGNLNVELVGQFGYTDIDAEGNPVTPGLVKQVIMKLVMRELPQIMTDAGQKERKIVNAISETTDGHSYTLAGIAASGGLTGDPEIDNIVALYSAPITCAVL